MSIIGNPIMAGVSGPAASIFVTGLSETDIVTATKGSKTLTGKWTQKPNPEFVSLPSGYTQLEYIESDGNQYIDTNLETSEKIGVKLSLSFSTIPSKTINAIGGECSSGKYWGITVSPQSYIGSYWGTGAGPNSSVVSTNTFHAVELNYKNSHIFKVDNKEYLLSSESVGAGKIYICDISHSTTRQRYVGKLGIIELTNEGEIIRKFIPSKRNSDSVVGLYDLITNVFYTNSGTGTFNAGPEVPQTIDGFLIKPIRDFGTWTVTATNGTNTATQDVLVDTITDYTISMSYVHIYGVTWDGSSVTTWVRTDDSEDFADPVPAVANGSGSSPFDGLYPWSGMVRVTDSEAGELVAIPKFWYKWTTNGSKLKLQIADMAADGFSVSPAHMDRGDGNGERDIVYVGRYHCESGYKSTTDVAQQTGITRSTARTNIHNLGATIWQFDYAMRLTIQMLYIVEFADWNSQTKIGYGCSASGSKANNGQTDAMQYHTGTTAVNRTTYGYTQYRNIEGLWDNVYDWMDGCYYNGSGLNIIVNPANFSDSGNGTVVGSMPSVGYPNAMKISTVSGLGWVLMPSSTRGSDSTYVPDYWSFDSSNTCLCVGGYSYHSLDFGLFYVGCTVASYSSPSVGCRLMKLP